MPMIPIEAQLTAGQLLKALEQMPPAELTQFIEKAVLLRASQRAPRLSKAESALMEKINMGLSPEDQLHLDDLIATRETRDLDVAENAAFLRLTEKLEAFNVERMTALTDLAALRQQPLRELMQDLGITRPSDA